MKRQKANRKVHQQRVRSWEGQVAKSCGGCRERVWLPWVRAPQGKWTDQGRGILKEVMGKNFPNLI